MNEQNKSQTNTPIQRLKNNWLITVSVIVIISMLVSGGSMFLWQLKEGGGQFEAKIIFLEKQIIQLNNQISNLQNKLSQLQEDKEIIPEENTANEATKINEVILHPECTKENPPKIYTYVKMSKGLDLCGEKTKFAAYEFKDEKVILFVDFSFGNYENKTHTLRLISTESPFEEIILGSFIGSNGIMTGLGAGGYYIDDFFVLWTSADGPGDLKNIFIFNPKTKEYIIAERSSWNAKQKLSVSSSISETNYFAEYNTESFLGPDEVYAIKDEDIKLIINEKVYTKKEMTEGRGKEYLNIFDCQFIDIGSFNSEDSVLRSEKRLREYYLKYFPAKIPCCENSYWDDPGIIGFLDLKNNKFVPE